MLPLQVPVTEVVAIFKPAGKVSTKLMVVAGCPGGCVIVNVALLVSFSKMVVGLNALTIGNRNILTIRQALLTPLVALTNPEILPGPLVNAGGFAVQSSLKDPITLVMLTEIWQLPVPPEGSNAPDTLMSVAVALNAVPSALVTVAPQVFVEIVAD